MPKPSASSVFHGSCPTSPGSRNAATSAASGQDASGSGMRCAYHGVGCAGTGYWTIFNVCPATGSPFG